MSTSAHPDLAREHSTPEPEKPQAALRAAPEGDDSFRYWRYRDLKERGIVSSRVDLFTKQKKHAFPRAIHFSTGHLPAAYFKVADVKQWLRDREAAERKRPAAVAVRPPKPEVPQAEKRPRGRPRKVQPGQHLEAAE